MPLDTLAPMDTKPAEHVQLWQSHPAVAASPVKAKPPPPACRTWPPPSAEPLTHPLLTHTRTHAHPAAAAPTPARAPPLPPPAQRGVALSALLKLGAGLPRHLTTAEVVERYIVPATASRMAPYAALLPPAALGPPAFLVLHSRAAPFAHLLAQLRARFHPPGAPPADPHLWLDLLALTHHPAAARTPRELALELETAAALAATTPTLLSLGPHAEALHDLAPLHALAALVAAHRHPHLHPLTAHPPALPHLTEALAALDVTAAAAPTHADRRATLDAIAALLARPHPHPSPSSPTAPHTSAPRHNHHHHHHSPPAAAATLPTRAADPAAAAAAAVNPLLQRALLDRTAAAAAAAAEAAPTPADLADCRFLQAAVLLAGPRPGPRDSLLESAEHLAAHCLTLRAAAATAASARGGSTPAAAAAVAGVAAAQELLAEAIRQREAGAAAGAAGHGTGGGDDGVDVPGFDRDDADTHMDTGLGAGRGEGRLPVALRLLEEAARELLGARCRVEAAGGPRDGAELAQQAARALVAAAEVCNQLCRYPQAQDLAARALRLLPSPADEPPPPTPTATAAPTTHATDRAAANAALGHSLLHQGDPDAAAAPLHAAAQHHAAAAPLPTSPAPYCRRAAPVLHDYSTALLRLGRVAEATHWARRSLAAAEAAHGPEEPTTADCMEALAAALLEHHSPSPASSSAASPPSPSTSASSNASSSTCGGSPPADPPATYLTASPPAHPSSSGSSSASSSAFLTSPFAHPSCLPPASPPRPSPPHPSASAFAHPACSPPTTAAPLHPAFSTPPGPPTPLSSSATSSSTPPTPPAHPRAPLTLATAASAPLPPAAPAPPCSEAEELLRRRLRVTLQHHGRGHPMVLRCSLALAQALHRTRQHPEAELIYLGLLQSLREALPPPSSPPTLPPPPPTAAPHPPTTTPSSAPPSPARPTAAAAASPASSPASPAQARPAAASAAAAAAASPFFTPRAPCGRVPEAPEPYGPEEDDDDGGAMEPATTTPAPVAVLAAEASWGSAGCCCVEVAGDPMLLCGEAELAGMKTLLGGARSSSSTLDEALWRADHVAATRCAAGAAAAAAPVAAGGGGVGVGVLSEGCPGRPRLGDVLRELATVYDDWGRPADAELCRRQALALLPQGP